jgi:nucleoside-diphosphate-sugar epimerase
MNLVIGNTSQLSYYFPEDYIKISSRNIDESIFNQHWNCVYICFAEQRTFKNNDKAFNDVNVDYTKEVIEKLNANKIIYYSTAEMWNNTVGEIDLNTPIKYHHSDYIDSKENITNYLKENYKNVYIAYPFNFNSKYRLPPFLFGKVIDSIVNKTQIELGDTYYYRELLHPSYIVNETINLATHKIIGTGELIFINTFIRKLYDTFDMKYNDYVTENIKDFSIYRKNIFYSKSQNNFRKFNLYNILVKEIYYDKQNRNNK